jgi:hypothetical protein
MSINTITIAAAVGTLAATALGLAGTAAAAATGTPSAADTVTSLQADGYNVQINQESGIPNVPLSQCNVTGVHGLSNTADPSGRIGPAQFSTVYVDVSCPSDS